MLSKITRFLIFLLALGVVAYGTARLWPGIKDSGKYLPNQNQMVTIFGIPKNEATSLPDWSTESLLKKINDYRESQKLTPLSLNDKLTNAAKSRLAVIAEFNDYSGTETGLSREKSLDSVGYRYSWVGDLVLVNYFKNNDPIKYWQSISNSNDTLVNKNLKEIGLAIKQNEEQVSAYIILATQSKPVKVTTTTKPIISWSGPDLWKEVNKRREELGVNPLKQRDELCTIAAIRLNQLLETGSLDGHLGFQPTLDRSDLKWISEKYNISEFLVSGYKTAFESVKAWENTLGHRKLLAGGEYVWGCVYAQAGIGVAIAAY